jgi:hypothetical protein
MDLIKCTVDGFPDTVDGSPLKKALEMRIKRAASNVKHTAADIKSIVDDYLTSEKDDIPNIKSSAMVIHNTNCLMIKLNAISTNEINLCDLTRLYNMEGIGMEYEFLPKLGALTLYLYPLEYRIPNWVNFNQSRYN